MGVNQDHLRERQLSCPPSPKHRLLSRVGEGIRSLPSPEYHRHYSAVIGVNQLPLSHSEARPEYCRVAETRNRGWAGHRATPEARIIFNWILWTISRRWRRRRLRFVMDLTSIDNYAKTHFINSIVISIIRERILKPISSVGAVKDVQDVDGTSVRDPTTGR